MKQTIQLLVLLLVLAMLPNCKKAENNNLIYDKQYIDEIKQIRKELSFYMRINFIPGAQIAISKNGKLIYSEGIGLASKDLDVKTTRNTKFRIGPLSELYTTLLYLKLIEDGILSPDSTIQHYMPEFPEKKYRITLDNLKNHTSGIRRLNSQESAWQGTNVTLQKGLEIFQDDELIAPPGEYQQESRLNFNLLGAIMEKTSGMPYNKLLKTYVTDTLHLDNTCPDNPYLTISGRSNFYAQNIMAQVVNALSIDMRWRAPSDGLLSSAEDLVKLSNVFLRSNYLNDSTRAHLFDPVILNNNQQAKFTNGWTIFNDRQGNSAYARKGFVHGGSAEVLLYPKEELVIALTTNLTQDRSETQVFKLVDILLPQPVESKE